MTQRFSVPPRPALPTEEAAQRLRDLLESAHYTESGVRELLQLNEFPFLRGADLPLLLHRTSRGRPLDTLVRLFLMEQMVEQEAVEKAFGRIDLAGLVRMDLLERHGNLVCARVKLLPFQGLWVAFDRESYLRDFPGQDYVMGIGRSSLTLANLTVRRRARSTLDLGTGCGIQGLLAARHSDRVTATDLNDRAVAMATFNARLNGLSNVTCIEGNLLEPVEGQRFDLIVSNPPFVISPESRYIYRDGGLPADELCRRILREGAEKLEEGGFCQVLCNWAQTAGEDWKDTLSRWTRGLACDAWVMRSESRDAATYASTWIQHTERSDSSDWGRRLEDWLSYFDRLGIASVGAGLITLRRASGRSNWVRIDEAPPSMLGPCGDDLQRGFALCDFLETVRSDESLLEEALRAVPDLGLEQSYHLGADGWEETGTRLFKTQGLAWTGGCDTLVANLIAACDGSRRLRDVIDSIATALGARREELEGPLCRAVRGLVQQGFLLPRSTT